VKKLPEVVSEVTDPSDINSLYRLLERREVDTEFKTDFLREINLEELAETKTERSFRNYFIDITKSQSEADIDREIVFFEAVLKKADIIQNGTDE
jgi:hypothetical protein